MLQRLRSSPLSPSIASGVGDEPPRYLRSSSLDAGLPRFARRAVCTHGSRFFNLHHRRVRHGDLQQSGGEG